MAFAQSHVVGRIADSKSGIALTDVTVIVRGRHWGTISDLAGGFDLEISKELLNDTVSFSKLGYFELKIPVRQLSIVKSNTINLIEKITSLNEVTITGGKLREKKFGIKHKGVVHFTDGMFKKNSRYEIGQLIDLGKAGGQITSLNFHLSAARDDSASFGISFYRFDENQNRPAGRALEKTIVQRHPVREGWMKFDLTAEDIVLKGKLLVALEFIPEVKEPGKQIITTIKLGGTSRTFFRRNTTGPWITPPHHYCLYVTALVDPSVPDDREEEESVPAVKLKADYAQDPFSIFVRVPKGYSHQRKQRYPVVYQLDGNAYFDPVAGAVKFLNERKLLAETPIIVGIGYENAYVMDSLRDRDYTFPEAQPEDSFRLSGKAELFYQFIKSHIIPYVDQNYRTDTTSRTIMGHSLGGYFVLYSLLRHSGKQGKFRNYVAASPSLWYGEKYLPREVQKLQECGAEPGGKLFLTMGDLELAPGDSTFDQFGKALRKLPGMKVETKIYPNTEHMGTAVSSFEDGLKFIFPAAGKK